jgi:hypothetical protein
MVLPGVASGDLPDVFLGNLFLFLKFRIDGEFRANQGAETAVDAIFCMKHQLRWMIALGIETLALFEAGIGAEFNTKSATLAPGLNDSHMAHRYGMGFSIEGQTPELHFTCSTVSCS